jgi:hypothetical protein
VTLRVADHDLSVRTTSARLGAWLEDVASAHVVDAAPARAAYSIVVGEPRQVGRPVHVLYRGGSEILRDTALSRIVASLLAELDTYGLAEREDALHVAGSLVRAGGRAVVGPAFLHPVLGRRGRRALRSGIRQAPAAAFSVDLDTGEASAPPRGLSVPPDALEHLVSTMPDAAEPSDPWWSEPSPIAAVVLFGSGPTVPPAPTRAETLHELAERSLNLRRVGGPGLIALRRLVEGAVCIRSGWMGGDGWLGLLHEAATASHR